MTVISKVISWHFKFKLKFSLKWDLVGVKFSNATHSYSYDSFSTKLF